MTAPSAKNKSENSNAVVPSAAPSLASGTKAVDAVIVVADSVLAPTIVPETSRFPFTSIRVELSSISSSALISKSPSAGEPILIAESRNCITEALFKSNPVSATCVKITSASAPNFISAASDASNKSSVRVKSSPIVKSVNDATASVILLNAMKLPYSASVFSSTDSSLVSVSFSASSDAFIETRNAFVKACSATWT